MDKVDWALLLTALVLASYVAYLLVGDDADDATTVAAYWKGYSIVCQWLARRIGQAGINAELAYFKTLELGRMI